MRSGVMHPPHRGRKERKRRMLEAKNLSFSYEKKSDPRKILADVTLSVKPGERVGNSGAERSGKNHPSQNSGRISFSGLRLCACGRTAASEEGTLPGAAHLAAPGKGGESQASAGKDAGGGRTGESGTGAPPGHPAGMEKPFSPRSFLVESCSASVSPGRWGRERNICSATRSAPCWI